MAAIKYHTLVPTLLVKCKDPLGKVANEYVAANNAASKPIIVKNNHVNSSNSSCTKIPEASRNVDRICCWRVDDRFDHRIVHDKVKCLGYNIAPD